MLDSFYAFHEGYKIVALYDAANDKITKTIITDREDGMKMDKRYISKADMEAMNNKIHIKIGQARAAEAKIDVFGGIKTGRKHKAAAPSKAEKQAKKEVEAIQKPAKIEAAWRRRYQITNRSIDDTHIVLSGEYAYDQETDDFTMDRHVRIYLENNYRIISHAFGFNSYSVIMERK